MYRLPRGGPRLACNERLIPCSATILILFSQQLQALIAEHGWAVRNVGAFANAPRFSYTVGLTALDHAELVMVGLPFEVSQAFLNLAGDMVRRGRQFQPGELTEDLAEGGPIAIIRADDTAELTAVGQVYGTVSALQLVWSDSDGYLPWDNGYANDPGAQAILGPLLALWNQNDES
jgi:hypothetical protein